MVEINQGKPSVNLQSFCDARLLICQPQHYSFVCHLILGLRKCKITKTNLYKALYFFWSNIGCKYAWLNDCIHAIMHAWVFESIYGYACLCGCEYVCMCVCMCKLVGVHDCVWVCVVWSSKVKGTHSIQLKEGVKKLSNVWPPLCEGNTSQTLKQLLKLPLPTHLNARSTLDFSWI